MTTALQMSAGPAPIAACSFRDDVRPDDRHTVKALVERTGYFRADEIEIAIELVEERLARGASSGYEFIFAEIKATLVGYACYGPIPCTAASFDLYWIAVDPRQQRNGIGRALVEAVEQSAFTSVPPGRISTLRRGLSTNGTDSIAMPG
jgi:GNAT superfamily N-acetyltransferase